MGSIQFSTLRVNTAQNIEFEKTEVDHAEYILKRKEELYASGIFHNVVSMTIVAPDFSRAVNIMLQKTYAEKKKSEEKERESKNVL